MTDYKILKAIRNGTEYEIPTEKNFFVNALLVGGGGGGGGGNYCNAWAGGGGGGGGVECFNSLYIKNNSCIIIGCGGSSDTNGGNSYICDDIGIKAKAYGGSKGWFGGCCNCSFTMQANGGNSGNGFVGGYATPYMYSSYGSGGGAGAGGNGCDTTGYNCYGGNGGPGLYGYGGGGGGGSRNGNGAGTDGGGNGGNYGYIGCNATCYGGGGGGSGAGNSVCPVLGGCGYQGMVEICYPTNGSYGFTSATGGDCCYTCNGYRVHRFTSDGTFTIVS